MAAEKKEESKFEMEYVMLGETGLKVSRLGMGTMSFDSIEQAIALMSTVRKYGVNFFDNAELYGQPCGNAEILFGSALKKLQEKDAKLWRRSELVITTKLYYGPAFGDETNSRSRTYGVNEKGLNRKHLMEGINSSLKRLQLEYVDVIMAHRYDPITPMIEIVRGFTDIIRKGKAFYWGTSMWPPQKLTEAYWVAKINKLIPPVVEQPVYHMFSRKVVEVDYQPMFAMPYNLGTTTWSPLDAGILTGKYNKEIPKGSRMDGESNRLAKWWGGKNYVKEEKIKKVEKLMQIAKELDISMVNLALAWVIKNKNVSVCLLGGSKASQLEENVKSIDAAKKLNADVMKKIDEILDNKPAVDSAYTWGNRSLSKNITNPL